jgi:hypothetical protein
MSERQICVDCRKESPETETNYTLIGSRHGWRLTRRAGTDGERVMEWRCPECWRAYKAGSGEVPHSSRVQVAEPKPKSGTHAVADSDSPSPPQRTRKR